MQKYISWRTQAVVTTSTWGGESRHLISGLKNAKWLIRWVNLDPGRTELASPTGEVRLLIFTPGPFSLISGLCSQRALKKIKTLKLGFQIWVLQASLETLSSIWDQMFFLLLEPQKGQWHKILKSNTLTGGGGGECHDKVAKLSSGGPWTIRDPGSCVWDSWFEFPGYFSHISLGSGGEECLTVQYWIFVLASTFPTLEQIRLSFLILPPLTGRGLALLLGKLHHFLLSRHCMCTFQSNSLLLYKQHSLFPNFRQSCVLS